MIFWNFFASAEALGVEGVVANVASVLVVKASQSARLKFTKYFFWRVGGESSVLISKVMGKGTAAQSVAWLTAVRWVRGSILTPGGRS